MHLNLTRLYYVIDVCFCFVYCFVFYRLWVTLSRSSMYIWCTTFKQLLDIASYRKNQRITHTRTHTHARTRVYMYILLYTLINTILTERNRQPERHTDRYTDGGSAGRQADRPQRQTDRKTGIQTDRQTDRQIYGRRISRQAGRQTDMRKGRQSSILAVPQFNNWTNPKDFVSRGLTWDVTFWKYEYANGPTNIFNSVPPHYTPPHTQSRHTHTHTRTHRAWRHHSAAV